MIDFGFILKVITSISGFCLGWRLITDRGMILEFIREFSLRDYIPQWVAKPFVLCITCLASVHGTWIFWLLYTKSGRPIELFTIFEWVFCCIVCSFLNTFVWELFQLIKKNNN
jgi:hypothetical protein